MYSFWYLSCKSVRMLSQANLDFKVSKTHFLLWYKLQIIDLWPLWGAFYLLFLNLNNYCSCSSSARAQVLQSLEAPRLKGVTGIFVLWRDVSGKLDWNRRGQHRLQGWQRESCLSYSTCRYSPVQAVHFTLMTDAKISNRGESNGEGADSLLSSRVCSSQRCSGWFPAGAGKIDVGCIFWVCKFWQYCLCGSFLIAYKGYFDNCLEVIRKSLCAGLGITIPIMATNPR